MEAAFRQLWRKFQSTLSVRRATWRPLTMEQSEAISIHALRKESDFGFRGSVAGKHISIHALRKESDRLNSARVRSQRISIHALRKESDVTKVNRIMGLHDFNPRSP